MPFLFYVTRVTSLRACKLYATLLRVFFFAVYVVLHKMV